MIKILVTGGSGMLGSAMIRSLRSAHTCILSPSRNQLNLLDYENTRQYIERNNPDIVVHCAARVGGILGNIHNSVNFLSENILIDFNLMSVCLKFRIKQLLYFGSSCMYPVTAIQPFKPEILLSGKPETTNESYALAKLSGWKMTQAVSFTHNLDWKTWILSNLYGPGDHFDPARSHLIAAIISKVSSAVREKQSRIDIWGSGTPKREFTYVEDVSEYLAFSLSSFHKLPQTMNLGSGQEFSVMEYYEIVAKLYGFAGSLVLDPTKPDGAMRKLMDSKVAQTWGWKSRTDLELGLSRTIEWYEESSRGERL
jgi:GDP-L-fucose synthase